MACRSQRLTAMAPSTRLDKVVKVRKREEDAASVGLARAHAAVRRAQEELERAVEAAGRDPRSGGPIELWQLEELEHRRALQSMRSAETGLREAERGEACARSGYADAHRRAEVVRRAQDRQCAEIMADQEKRERKDIDEIATLRFNAERPS